MIPIRDSVKASRTPVVNITLIVANALVFYLQLQATPDSEVMIRKFGLVASRLYASMQMTPPDWPGVGIPFITSMFLHGGWLHFLGNMWFLYIFGDNVEDRLGKVRYLCFYILCGIAAGFTQIQFMGTSSVPLIGASGAIAGVMGAYLLLYPKGKVLTLVPIIFFIQFIEIPAFIFLIIWIGLQSLQGFFSIGSEAGGGVAWWAHIGGFVIGAILILIFTMGRLHKPPQSQFSA